eukprot:TRINITY_DN19682_c0_g1_i1.p1 TRINITY_DN19682_c0_g1~~TRINITY_DN19682_c0_g1_i1.p1  ORF type:complete len:229 (+),score=40.66 TRINITY_DN19682_c0_g1_i1:84-770(+)
MFSSPSRSSMQRSESFMSSPAPAAPFSSTEQRSLYEITSGLVTLRTQPSRKAAAASALQAGMRFFATAVIDGDGVGSKWLLVHLRDIEDPAADAEAKPFVGATSSGLGRGGAAAPIFCSDDVALNLYTRGAPLPAFSGNACVKNGPLWIEEDCRHMRRIRAAHGEGIVGLSGHLKVAWKESACPRRRRDPVRAWSHSGLMPSKIGNAPVCNINFQRSRIVDLRMALEL